MRIAIASLALLAAFAIPAAAHADTFTFTPTGGTPFSFSFAPEYVTPGASVEEDSSTFDVAFVNPAVYASYGFGNLDFAYKFAGDNAQGFTGDQLYVAGTEAAPVFFPGTYTLGSDDLYDIAVGSPSLSGTLVIDGPSATPEPSSLILLGTGILGFAGFARRSVFAKR